MNKQIYNTLMLFISIASLFTALTVQAQISREGVPPSFSVEGLSGIVPVITLDPLPQDVIATIDDNLRTSPGPYRIGKTIPVNVTCDNAGLWEDLAKGGKVWRLKLQSEGALAVSLYFDQFILPAGGELYAYNEMKTQVIGAFTDFNNDPSGLFSTEIIQGESVTLEYFQPENVSLQPVISISDMAYIFRGVSFETFPGNERGGSDWCMINVNCPEGDNWQYEKRGVVRQYMILPDSYIGWCSGSLINNTSWNLEPYVLSAHHCGEGCSSGMFNQWIFYFKYEAATCTGNSGPANFTMTGCQLKAEGDRYVGSDFALYLLNQDIPDTHEPYWNGWNRTNVASTSGVGIHHPMGDIKKISTYTQTLGESQWNNNGVLSHWKVYWAPTENGLSIVESGSSGSPLFDYMHNIVGDLGGGPEDNCNNPAYSLYGKVYWSWDKMGSQPSQQLKAWLDPQNTGQEYQPGTYGIAPIVDFEANDPTIAPGSCVNFFDRSLGTPVEWQWTFTGGEPSTSTDKNPQGIVFNEYGTHTVKLTASNPFGSDTETKTGYIEVGDAPIADFYTENTEVMTGVGVYFFDASQKDPTAWSWQFEGGTPSASFVQNPGPIYYMTPGVYQVKMTAINDFGSDTETRAGYMTVLGPPNADFTASQTMIPIGGSVNFTDLSTGNPTSWQWNFQGGTPSISTEQNPQEIVYDEAGEFNVTLSVSSDIGTDDTTMVGYIQVVAAPVPNFTSPNRYIQAGTTTTFTDYTTGNPTSWFWEFEGGTPATSDLQDPGAILYSTVGDFDATLTATNEYGSQSVTKPNYIHVGDVPQADFMASETFIAVGTSINFADQSTNSPTTWTWVFEGGTPGTSSLKNPLPVTYEQVGIYDVTLTVTNAYGEDTEVKTNFVEVGYVGMDDRRLTAEHIELYPNPTTGALVLDLKGDVSDVVSIRCYNSLGERILEITREQGILHQMQFDLAGNPPGLYLLSVHTENDLIIKRITLVQ
ncbi:MAG TPA: PKD domain-containing protein [Bacteroidales bacterium]|nr:PKD domain-containing protein [Bacteroidales bacterium]